MNGVINGGKQKGFTLIEALVAMIIVSVTLLAMGAFTLAVMRSDNTAKQRTVGMHVAEQALEDWYSGLTPAASQTVNSTVYTIQTSSTNFGGGAGTGPASQVRSVTVSWSNASGPHQVTVSNLQKTQ